VAQDMKYFLMCKKKVINSGFHESRWISRLVEKLLVPYQELCAVETVP
jgi:hypothetical protein